MQDLHESWGEELGRLMDEAGISNRSMAKSCGVSDTTILRIRTGVLNPNDELKFKIAGVLRVRMDKLWAWPAIVPPNPVDRVAS